MGNSTLSLQAIVDSAQTIGDLNVSFGDVAGFSAEPALSIANATMGDLVSQRFNWKWNAIKLPPVLMNGNQQDYPLLTTPPVGWLESALVQDVNSTSFPKPTYPVLAVRGLPVSTWLGGRPAQVSWNTNNLLEYDIWPGPATVYVNPLGNPASIPNPPPTAIEDTNGNILVLAGYGTTGPTAPFAEAGAAPLTAVEDGTVQWRVADPGAMGFRVAPRPASGTTPWLLRAFAQRAPRRFVSLVETIDPVPDSYSKWFQDGFNAYARRHSASPSVRAGYEAARRDWLESMDRAIQEGNREEENFGFYPGRTVMDGRVNYGPTVGNPLGWRTG